MILMVHWFNAAVPKCHTSNLLGTTVTFNKEQIIFQKQGLFYLALLQTNFLNVIKFKAIEEYICNTKIWHLYGEVRSVRVLR